MEVNRLVTHYKANYEHKVFMTRLSHTMQNAYIMYIYDYPHELKNFSDTFLAYLPFYIRNSDYFETVNENEDVDAQLIARSKNMRKNSKIIPHRRIASDGIYGELFLDFYLRIVNGRKAVITYANKRSFDSNYESTGPDNIVYFLDENEKINICFCEAKFVTGASIIQYKIPFYTSFFVSILKLFLQKNSLGTALDLSCLDAKKITLLFEDGSIYDDYSKLIDYGIPNDLVMKLHDRHITTAELQESKYDKAEFDDYEQLLLNDFLSIL